MNGRLVGKMGAGVFLTELPNGYRLVSVANRRAARRSGENEYQVGERVRLRLDPGAMSRGLIIARMEAEG